MLLIQRVFGTSCVGYDPGADGEEYDHRAWLLQRAIPEGDSENDDAFGCFAKTLQRYSALKQDKDWACDGSARLRGELFCPQCLDHVD
jgi:hypothetical protein